MLADRTPLCHAAIGHLLLNVTGIRPPGHPAESPVTCRGGGYVPCVRKAGGPRVVAWRTAGSAGAVDSTDSTPTTTRIAVGTERSAGLTTGVCCVTTQAAHGVVAFPAWR